MVCIQRSDLFRECLTAQSEKGQQKDRGAQMYKHYHIFKDYVKCEGFILKENYV